MQQYNQSYLLSHSGLVYKIAFWTLVFCVSKCIEIVWGFGRLCTYILLVS